MGGQGVGLEVCGYFLIIILLDIFINLLILTAILGAGFYQCFESIIFIINCFLLTVIVIFHFFVASSCDKFDTTHVYSTIMMNIFLEEEEKTKCLILDSIVVRHRRAYTV